MTEETYRRLMLKHAAVQTEALCEIYCAILSSDESDRAFALAERFKTNEGVYELQNETEKALTPIGENPYDAVKVQSYPML